MHTSRALSNADFEIRADGARATVDDVLPGFDEHTRLGIVITQRRRRGGRQHADPRGGDGVL